MQEKIEGGFLSIALYLHIEKTNVLLCCTGMRLPVATRCHPLRAKEKQLHGNAGKHTLI